jgi:hypothetical protein
VRLAATVNSEAFGEPEELAVRTFDIVSCPHIRSEGPPPSSRDQESGHRKGLSYGSMGGAFISRESTGSASRPQTTAFTGECSSLGFLIGEGAISEPSTFPRSLWQRPMDEYLDFIAEQGFNALRIPFSVALALALDETAPKPDFVGGDPSLKDLTSGAILDKCVLLPKCHC